MTFWQFASEHPVLVVILALLVTSAIETAFISWGNKK